MIVIPFGPPGSGKGTQSKLLAESTGMVHVSTGEILRAEIAAGTALGKEAAPVVGAGHLVSDDLMIRIIESRLQQPDTRAGVILDGFPRTVVQAEQLDNMLTRIRERIAGIICFDVPATELESRINVRAGTEHRADDGKGLLEERLRVYETQTAPILDYYRSKGSAIRTINGVGSVQEVASRLRGALESINGELVR